MSYTAESMSGGEFVVFTTGRHWIVLMFPALLAISLISVSLIFLLETNDATLGLTLSAIAVFLMLFALLARRAVEFTLTNRRVIQKRGLISTSVTEVFLTKIEGVSLQRGLLGKVCGYGNLAVRGTGGTHEVFSIVAKPMEFRLAIQEQLERLLEWSPAFQGRLSQRDVEVARVQPPLSAPEQETSLQRRRKGWR